MPEFAPLLSSARRGFKNMGRLSFTSPGRIVDVKFNDFCPMSSAADKAVLAELKFADGTTANSLAAKLNSYVYGLELTTFLARLGNGYVGCALNADNYTVFACGELVCSLLKMCVGRCVG